jgi:hypothetical protein
MKTRVSSLSWAVLAGAASVVCLGCALVTDQGHGRSTPAPRIHPQVFSMVENWLSDTEGPVVTEINLDAMERDRNQFPMDELKQKDVWTVWDTAEGRGFERYRVL